MDGIGIDASATYRRNICIIYVIKATLWRVVLLLHIAEALTSLLKTMVKMWWRQALVWVRFARQGAGSRCLWAVRSKSEDVHPPTTTLLPLLSFLPLLLLHNHHVKCFSLDRLSWSSDPSKVAPEERLPVWGAPWHRFIINATYVYSNLRTGCERGLQEAPPTEAVKTEGGGIKWGKERMERSCELQIEKIALRAQRNSHSIGYELSVKCKCIPQQPRNKQAATSLAYN